MRTLLIDNYDSYTYNLFQVIAEVNGELPLVYHNDEITLEQISSMVQAGTVHSIVISPGPGTPSNPHDIGICLDVLQQLPDVPVLGICLGHQALALAHGAAVVLAPEPVHGRLSRLRHTGHELFRDIPSGEGFDVVRYHSLLVDEQSLPDCLEAVCWTAGGHTAVKLARDGAEPPGPAGTAGAAAASAEARSAAAVVPEHGGEPRQPTRTDAQPPVSLLMGLAHRSRPHYGVQFHPESVATRYGIALLRNFRDLAAEHVRRRAGPAAAQLPPARHVVDLVGPPGRLPELASWPSPEHQRGACLRLAWTRLPGLLAHLPGGSQAVFELLYGWAHDTFWLDSAATDRGRFSYMGGRGGPLWRKLTYKLPPPRPQHPALQPGLEQQGPGRAHLAGGSDCSQQQQQQLPDPDPHHQEQLAGAGAGADPDSDAASSSSAGTSSACGPASSACTCCSPTASAGHSGATAPPVAAAARGGTLTVETVDGCVSRQAAPSGLLGHLQELLSRERLLVEAEAAAQLPFNFWGGLVGYLGYELKAECGAANVHAASTPDALLYLADRLVAVDHAEGDVFLLAMYDGRAAGCDGAGEPEPGREDAAASKAAPGPVDISAAAAEQKALAEAWLLETQRALEAAVADTAARALDGSLRHDDGGQPGGTACVAAAAGAVTSALPQPQHPASPCGQVEQSVAAGPPAPPVVPFVLEHSRGAYLRNISACHAALHAGESYEVCLTTALSRPAAPSLPALYRTLRRLNPAPYAAWLQCGAAGPTICCSSPERFLRGDRGGLLEARPIKGTAARVAANPVADAAAAAELASSEKERAENLMIVDLLRNDLGRVCEVGSVHVPGLMDIESYATVHQMVSTVRGVRRSGMSVIDCIRAAYPGGSMTGAPKVRTMQIIDGLEDRARGVYSGSIGFIALNDTFDLNIVIRTAVVEEPPALGGAGLGAPDAAGPPPARRMTIGAGGAIVVQSEPEAEYEEMRLKATALLRSVGICEGGTGPVPVLAD